MGEKLALQIRCGFRNCQESTRFDGVIWMSAKKIFKIAKNKDVCLCVWHATNWSPMWKALRFKVIRYTCVYRSSNGCQFFARRHTIYLLVHLHGNGNHLRKTTALASETRRKSQKVKRTQQNKTKLNTNREISDIISLFLL